MSLQFGAVPKGSGAFVERPITQSKFSIFPINLYLSLVIVVTCMSLDKKENPPTWRLQITTALFIPFCQLQKYGRTLNYLKLTSGENRHNIATLLTDAFALYVQRQRGSCALLGGTPQYHNKVAAQTQDALLQVAWRDLNMAEQVAIAAVSHYFVSNGPPYIPVL